MSQTFKRILFFVLLPALALASAISVESGGFQFLSGLTMTAPNGNNAIILQGGSRFCLEPTCVKYFDYNTGNGNFDIVGIGPLNVANGGAVFAGSVTTTTGFVAQQAGNKTAISLSANGEIAGDGTAVGAAPTYSLYYNGAGTWAFRGGPVVQAGTWSSSASSGNNGFLCQVAGCRFNLNNGTDYLYDNAGQATFNSSVSASFFSATAASGTNALGVNSNARLLLNQDGAGNDYIYDNGGGTAKFNAGVESVGNMQTDGNFNFGGSGVLNFNNDTAHQLGPSGNFIYSNATFIPSSNNTIDLGANVTRWRNIYAGSSIFAGSTVQVDNGVFQASGANNVPAKLLGEQNDGASAVGVVLDNAVTFANAGAKLLSIRNNTVEKAYFDLNGKLFIGGTQVQAGADVPISYYTAQTTGSGLLNQVTMTNGGTFKTAKFGTDVTGVGAGNFVVKVCTDGATCAAGNTAWTCTMACTSAADAITSCTAGAKTTWSAGDTISMSIATACATTNQVGGLMLGNTEP